MAGNASMQDIKHRIRSVTSIEHITSAMKLVSAAKLRRAKSAYESTTAYFHYVTEAIHDIAGSGEQVPEKYLRGTKKIRNSLYIVVTSNRGLAGSFNSSLIKAAETRMQKHTGNKYIVCVGSKGRDYFSKRDKNIIGEYMKPPESMQFIEAEDLAAPILKMYREGEIDEVIIIYSEFKSSLEQAPRALRLLPFDIKPDPDDEFHTNIVDYEPSVEEVFNYLVPKYVVMTIYQAIIESATCEHAARRMAMDSATDNANTMIGDLNLYYNRARQAAITSEISEIVSGAEAL
ncbi:MAG: ATP synthase F1 subunit gamma [Clostridiales Family XIII bacterium]|nr:ATP synthase F1 subunit gamma [Clostridiales Family XIII bacterium]